MKTERKNRNKNKLTRRERRGLYEHVRHEIEKLLTYDINKRRAKYSKEEHAEFLITTSLLNAFVEGISQSLRVTPSADTLLHYIKNQDQETLIKAFESQLKKNVSELKRQRKLWKRLSIAVDWTGEMFYGDYKNTPMVNGTKPKDG